MTIKTNTAPLKGFHNELAQAWATAGRSVRNVAQSIRSRLKTGEQYDRDYVASAAGELFEKFGKRERIQGGDGFTQSTDFDSFNTQVQAISAELGQKLKPAFNESNDQWELVPVKAKAPTKGKVKADNASKDTSESKGKSLSLAEVRQRYIELLSSLSVDLKEQELIGLRKALQLDPIPSNVLDMAIKAEFAKDAEIAQPVKPAAKRTKKRTAKAA